MGIPAKLARHLLPKNLRFQVKRIMHRLGRTPSPDEVLWIYEAMRARRGTMIDVGAHLGGSSIGFALAKWRVLAFEPDPWNREALLRAVPRGSDVHIDPRAVSDHDGDVLPLFAAAVSSGISSLHAFHIDHRPVAEVRTVTLRKAMEEFGIQHVDFLKIDAEGHDLFVLRGLDWDSKCPDVVLCEYEDRKTVPLGHGVCDIAAFLAERGYTLLFSEWWPIVEYGGIHRWRRITRDVEKLDVSGWGNIIACTDPAVADRLERFADDHTR